MKRRQGRHRSEAAVEEARVMSVAVLGLIAVAGHLWSIGEQLLTEDRPPAPASAPDDIRHGADTP
ncbi:hypothetical protein [Streptomyces sp. NPDC001889]